MKTYKTIAVLFLFAFAFSLVSCGNKENKEKLKNFYMNAIEYYKSDDYKTNILNDEYVMNKEKEIIKQSGFENEEEFQKIKMKLASDEEVYKLTTDLNTAKTDVLKEELKSTVDRLRIAEEKMGKVVEELDKASEEIDKTLDKDKDKDTKDKETKDKEVIEKEAKDKEKTNENKESDEK